MTVSARMSCWLTLAVIGACTSAGPGAVAPTEPEPARGSKTLEVAPDLVRLPGGSVGPFLMPVADGWLATWAAPDQRAETLTWHSATFDVDGRPTTAPRSLIEAPDGLVTLRLRSLNAQRGLVVGAFETEDSDPDDPSFGLATLAVSSTGTLLSGSATLVEDCDAIAWIEVVPLEKGALVSWAENLGDHAEVFGVVVDADGHRQTDLFQLHNSAKAWQLVKHRQGATLGVITIDGNVDVVSIGVDGKPGQPRVLMDGHSAGADLDLAVTGDRVLFAFSDRRALEPKLYSAWVSLDGGLRTEAKPMVAPYGAATLLGLRGTADGAVALWQNTAQEPNFVRLSPVDGEGRLTESSLSIPLPERKADVASRDVALPQLEATARGLVVMEPPCVDARACSEHADVLELTSELVPQTRLTWPGRTRADLVWDFQCGPSNCAALAATYGNRTTIEVLTTAAATRTPINGHKSKKEQRFRGNLEAVAKVDELAALAVSHAGGGTLVATLSAFDPNAPYELPSTPAPDGRLAPVQAQLKTHWFTNVGDGREPPTPVESSISIRARSVAGVEMTTSGDQTLLVWTAIDDKKPQVFVTLLDAKGQKVRQNMLTRQSGEILSLAAATGPDGFLYVGWVREEGALNKVYVARLNNVLGRQSADTVVAQTKGTVSSIDLAVTSASVNVVIAENHGGTESLKWVSLQPTTLSPKPNVDPFGAANEYVRFAPRVQTWGEGLALAWLERTKDTSQVRFLRLNRSGETLSSLTVGVPGAANTLDLACESECRVAVTGEQADGRGYVAHASMGATASDAAPPGFEVVTQALSPGASQVRPGVSADAVFYSDTSADGEQHFLYRAIRADK